jgi:thiol-disulfide isomerase/thioredoxin
MRLLIALFTLVVLTLGPSGPAWAVKPGDKAPALNYDGPAGAATLQQLRGRVVYVDFWASWCTPCRQAMPVYEAMHKEWESRGLTILGVNKDMRAADAERFLQRTPVSFRTFPDRDDAWARAFVVKTMPTGVLIDRKGVVRFIHQGYTSATEASVRQQIQQLLDES